MITAALSWAPELLAIRQAKATLGGNLLYDLFTIKNQTTIAPRQVSFNELFNNIFLQVMEREGAPSEFLEYGLQLPDNISELLDKIKPGAGSPITQESAQLATAINQVEEDEDNQNVQNGDGTTNT